MSKWYKASELERLRTLTPRDGVNGLPDNHVITVFERIISIDNTELIQNNIATDTFTLVLDAEWDDITPIAIFSNSVGNYSVMYEGSATKIPAKVMESTGDVEVSVYGVNEAGNVRVVTQRPESMGMTVIESGKFDGQVSSDDVSLLGKILAAVEEAEKSVKTANQAAENADTAAQSATDAATKATQAASTANTAANTANTAASNADSSVNTADTAAERAENAYTALQPVLADVGVSGNQLRGNLIGTILKADDTWPAKPMGIKVYGKTRQNLWVTPSGTLHGVTVTSDASGSVTVSGTSTVEGVARISSGKIYTLTPNTSYAFYIDKVSTSIRWFGVQCHNENDDNIGQPVIIGGSLAPQKSIVFTTPSTFASYTCAIGVPTVGSTVSGTYRVMLRKATPEEISKAVRTSQTLPIYPDGSNDELGIIPLNDGVSLLADSDFDDYWCPPGLNSVDELSVVTAGKNLLARLGPELPYTTAGITFSDNGDGGIRISGTASSSAYYNFFDTIIQRAPRITSGTYVASLVGGIENSVILNVGCFYDEVGGSYTPWLATPLTGASNNGSIDRLVYIRAFLSVASGMTVDTVVYPQLELGSTATDYEPPNITTSSIDLQGHTLNALPDGTRDELSVDATGAVTLVKRVGAVDYEASDFNPANPNYNEAVLSKPYAGGIDFSRSKQFSDFATIGNVHSAPGYPEISACTTNASSTLRGGTGSAESSSIEQNTKFKSMLGSATWHHLYALAAHETISLDPIILPLLPSPNITVYADAPITPDMELEYVRDVNKAIQKLEAKIADLVTKEAANV